MSRGSARTLLRGSRWLPGLLLLVVACGGQPDPASETHPRVASGTPVVLISIDTLRSDRLPMYGYTAVETPHLDALRKDAVLFEHAYSHVPMTLPAHASMLSGLLPPGHGVRDNLGYRLEADSLPWLPRILAREGYRTGAAVSAFVLRAATGMGADFELYEDDILQRSWRLGEAQRRGDRTLEASRDWLRQVHREPFFFLFHLYEPHQPLEPPEPFASRYASAYDGEVAAADAVVGDLLAELRALGVYDRAVIVLTSDHGEGLGDHGLEEHGPLLYREQLQVPLLLKLPGSRLGGSSVAEPAQLIDLLPTVLVLLGLEVPDNLPGASLLSLAPGGTEPRSVFGETFFPRLQFGWSELTSVIEYPYHLIQGPDPELYDLESDPGETRNLIREERRRYAALRESLSRYDGRFRPPTQVEDPETRARLAALGYLGSVGATGSESLADPKSKLPVLDVIGEGLEHAQAGEHARAVEVFRELLEEEPELIVAWEYLGNNLLRVGRVEAALAAYEEQMRLSAGSPLAALNVAGALLRLGRLEEAEEHALLAAEGHREALDILAQVALAQDDLEGAERYLEQRLAAGSEQPAVRITQAELLLRQGRPEAALELARKVAETVAREGIDPDLVRGLYLVQGEALGRLGEMDAAVAAFQREIEAYPDHLAAYAHLAMIYALGGRGRASGQILQRMLAVNPTPGAYAKAAETMRLLGDPASAEALLREARRRWPDSPALLSGGG